MWACLRCVCIVLWCVSAVCVLFCGVWACLCCVCIVASNLSSEHSHGGLLFIEKSRKMVPCDVISMAAAHQPCWQSGVFTDYV